MCRFLIQLKPDGIGKSGTEKGNILDEERINHKTRCAIVTGIVKLSALIIYFP